MSTSSFNPSRRDDETTQVIQVGGEGAPASGVQLRRDRCTLVMLAGRHPGSVTVVDRPEVVIGRGTQVDHQLDDSDLSRRHVRLFRRDSQWCIEDLGSTNGTWIHGERLVGIRALRDGDRIQMGKNTLFNTLLQDSEEQAATLRMYESAVIDPLTQVHNRRYLDERLSGEFAYAARHGVPLSVLLIDVDHFKQVNDKWGHLAGDAVLRVVAATLQRTVRVEDLVARFGGEEFAVVARGIDGRNALIFAERVRKLVAGLSIPWEEQTVRVTVSVGAACYDPTQSTAVSKVEDIIASADRALYQAKESGRNRCVLSS